MTIHTGGISILRINKDRGLLKKIHYSSLKDVVVKEKNLHLNLMTKLLQEQDKFFLK